MISTFLYFWCCVFRENYVNVWIPRMESHSGEGIVKRFIENMWFCYPWKKRWENLQVYIGRPKSTPVKSSHQDVILRPQFFNKTSWLHKLYHCIRRFSCIFNDSATKLQFMMELDYKQAWLNTIHNGGKLRSCAVFKRDFFLEKIFTQRVSRQSEKPNTPKN